LLDHKAEVNAKNQTGDRPLLLTSAGGHTQIAQQLLSAGAMCGAQQRSANGFASCVQDDYAQDELVKLLLSISADANARDRDGNTALMLAAGKGAFQVIETLLKGGADVNAENKDGQTALRLVKESKESWTRTSWTRKRDEISKLLKQVSPYNRVTVWRPCALPARAFHKKALLVRIADER